MYKKIGILGGMGPESTIKYYKSIINNYIKQNSNLDFPEIIVYSVNFGDMNRLLEFGSKNEYLNSLIECIKNLANAGADFVIIAANTPHLVIKGLKEKSPIPILSIVNVTLNRAKERGLKRLLLLGTKHTMQSDFYREEAEMLNLELMVPDESEQNLINEILYRELVMGIIKKESKGKILEIIKKYENAIDGIILGCTELPLIISQRDTTLPVLNTIEIHARAALRYSLGVK